MAANTVSFPHTSNSTAAVQKYEPVVASNFNAHFVLMNNLKNKLGDYGFLSEYIKSVGGLFVEKSGNVMEGGYKYVKFRYDSNEKETVYDVVVNFFNFLDDKSRMFIYNALVAWSRFKYNPLTGEKSLKKDYADACVVVEKFNRDGTLYWRRCGHNCFPMSEFEDQEANYATHEMSELAVTFAVDYVTDITNDPRLTTV
jgi:uncharacterized protein (UPF0297 family)